MYQCLSAMAPGPSTADAEHKGHRQAHDLIRYEKEDRRDGHHHKDHGGGDAGLAPRRPGDLLPLAADFLQEFEWTDHGTPAAFSEGAAAKLFEPACIGLFSDQAANGGRSGGTRTR